MAPERPTEPDSFDRELLARLADGASDGLVVVDDQGAIVYWNSGAERIFGYSSNDALGQSLDIIIPERLQERHWNAFHRAVQSGTTRYGAEDLLAVPARTADGRTISIEFTVVLLSAGDDIGYIGAVIRDVTARRSLDLELHHRIRELEEAASTPEARSDNS